MTVYRFLPFSITPVPANPLTDYSGGYVSNFARLNPTKAAAIAATQRFYTSKWHTLFDGLGCTYEASTDGWALGESQLRDFSRLWSYPRARHRISSTWQYPTELLERRLAAHHRRTDTDSASTITDRTWPWFTVTGASFWNLSFDPKQGRKVSLITYECTTLPYRMQSRRGRNSSKDLEVSTAGPTHFYHHARHPYPDIWNFTDNDITERVWWHTIGQSQALRPQPAPERNTLTIDTRHTVGTTVATPTGTYYLADDGKTTQLDDHTSITDCENDFYTRHPGELA